MHFSTKPSESVCGVLLAAYIFPIWLSAQDQLIFTGHYDLGINYIPGSGWEAYIHDYDNSSRHGALTTIYAVTEYSQATVPENPDYELLGEPGDIVWVVPEIYNPDVVYLGIGAPLLGRNIFTGGLSNRGQVTMRLVDVSGTGSDAGGTLSMWQSGFPPRFYFSDADGIGPEDSLNQVTANFHAHYNWGFTEPGLYQITFEVSGTLRPEHGGEYTSTEVTYRFEVLHAGDDSPLRYAWAVADGWEWSSWLDYVYSPFYPWIYTALHGWLYMPAASPDSVWWWSPEDGWCWTSQLHYPWLWRSRDGAWKWREIVSSGQPLISVN